MAKKIIVAEYDISIKGIQEKINELKTVLNNPNLGKGFSDKFNKDLLEIEKQLQKVSQSMPGAGATTAQIDKYGNKLEDVKSTLKEFVSGLSGFEISDKYLQKNIESLIPFNIFNLLPYNFVLKQFLPYQLFLLQLLCFAQQQNHNLQIHIQHLINLILSSF